MHYEDYMTVLIGTVLFLCIVTLLMSDNMTVFITTLLFLCIIALLILKQAKTSSMIIKNSNFDKLQSQYLIVYYLATFSDWLQGPYVYKLYSDYGYDDDSIAVLYIVGFISSSVFGMVVGHAADKYGRKFLCASFGILYTICCLTKISARFYVLFIGRVFGGISTSILFSTFEAWYVNEHLNHYKLPPEWLNETFGKAAFYTGLLAIVAGIISQFLAETLHLGSICPFMLAIPILISSTYMVLTTWQEHPPAQTKQDQSLLIFSALQLIFCQENILLLLCFVQSLYESVMYIFIFSWTPILSKADPPLGLVFSIFMVAFMIGTKMYTLLLSKRYRPQNLLTLTCAVGLVSHSIIAFTISSPWYANKEDTDKIPVYLCFFSFVLYEMSIGLYFPAIGYLRGRVVPETYRATVTNWFRVPMNIFTCFGLILKQTNAKIYYGITTKTSHITDKHSYKFPMIFISCSVFLVVTTLVSFLFGKMYSSKISKNETNPENQVNGAQHAIQDNTDNPEVTKSIPI